MHTRARIHFACLLFAFVPVVAQSQTYPARPVTLVVPYAAGGGMENLARAVSQRYTPGWEHPIIVDFRPGANSIIGTDYVVRSAPDGHTLLLSSSSLLLNANLYSKLPYDPSRDLVAVSGLIRDPFGIAVGPSQKISSMKELIALARSRPGEVSYATFGVGSSVHLVMEMLQLAAGIKLNHIPYKGTGPAMLDVTGGRVDMIINNASSLLPHWRAGKVRMIATTAAERSNMYPDVPTVAEVGLTGFNVAGWWGIHAPAKTPRGIVDRINADTRRILSDASFRGKVLDAQGYEPLLLPPQQFDSFIKGQAEQLSRIVRDMNIKMD